MAILQISRITNRKGLTENLPQLAGAELGWCVDSRRLFIGNGTLTEGAPVIGNTEILTQYSDITVLSNYTYTDIVVGYAPQTGPTVGDPVVRTVQAKLDDMASVRDFGAVGDGVADDTEAINRAMFQLYCRENNTQIRRSLFFPAGTYRITETIIIPTYAKLVGEGADHSIILLDTSSDISSLSAYVGRFGDSRQQTGVNIGSNGAVPPRNIEISSMTFQSVEDTDLFLVDRATQCWFDSVNFVGPLTQAEIEDASSTPLPDIAGVRFDGTSTLQSNNITFDKCGFTNITYGINTTALASGITVSNSRFNLLYQGVVTSGSSPQGFRTVHNVFDNIFFEGIDYNDSNLNVSAYNLFLNVGNSIGSSNPTSPVIAFANDNCVSINDLFERTDALTFDFPRVEIAGSTNASGGTQITLGRFTQTNGRTLTLLPGQTNSAVTVINSDNVKAITVQYTMQRALDIRTGTLQASTVTGTYVDDYVQDTDIGITLSTSVTGDTFTLQYTSTAGAAGTMTYTISHLA